MLKTDKFIRTMINGQLFYEYNEETPKDGFKIHEDNILSYVTKKGLIREIEATEPEPGKINIKVFDVKSNELIKDFTMQYKIKKCTHCNNVETKHAKKGERFYCTECGIYNDN